jgi:FkbM family methyltransferase
MTIYDKNYAMNEFTQHGEVWLQEKFSGKFKTIFDVGSNIGEWSRMTRSFHTEADIHQFELSPPTYRKMLSNIDIDEKMFPNSFGLSDKTEMISFKYKPSYDAVSSSILDLRLDNSEIRTGFVVTGDEYVTSRKIEQIDFLKIDTEGSEGKVLKGFEKTISEGKVKIIQFEYGFICVLTKWMLIDSYKFLTPYGYKLGKLKNGSIEFHDYSLTDENFIGPDYIAVHSSYWNMFGLS